MAAADDNNNIVGEENYGENEDMDRSIRLSYQNLMMKIKLYQSENQDEFDRKNSSINCSIGDFFKIDNDHQLEIL